MISGCVKLDKLDKENQLQATLYSYHEWERTKGVLNKEYVNYERPPSGYYVLCAIPLYWGYPELHRFQGCVNQLD